MKYCTFFGHSDCPDHILPVLRETVERLILAREADAFLVGNHGNFDALVKKVLREMSQKYPYVSYFVVLSYIPRRGFEEAEHTLLPEGIEAIPPRFAICYANEWMLKRAEICVTYVTRSFGGAARYAKKAARTGKRVIALGVCHNKNEKKTSAQL